MLLPPILIQHVQALVAIDGAALDALAAALWVRHADRHETLSRQGEVARNLYFVELGCLRVYATDVRGAEHVLRFAVEGWWLSDFHSFFTGEPSGHAIAALERSRLLGITRDDQERLCREHPVFEHYFRRMLEGLAVATHRRLLGMMAGSADERYADFLRTYRSIAQRLPQHQVASYLGITPEALSRLRARRAAGAVRAGQPPLPRAASDS